MRTSVVQKPDVDGSNQYYPASRPPLVQSPFAKLPLGSIRPRGWLRHQLDLMIDGMVGRIDEVSEYIQEDSSWLTPESDKGTEEVPYWLRGFYPLAVLTHNERLQEASHKWIDAAFASQQQSGYFGPHKFTSALRDGFGSSLIIQALMMDSVTQHYEYTRDDRVIPFMTRFFEYCRDLPDTEFVPQGRTIGQRRPCEMVEHIHWLYNQTGDSWLLDLAARFFRRFPHTTDQWPGRERMLASDVSDRPTRYRTDEWLAHHGVDFTHRYRYPGTYYAQSHASWHLVASEYWYSQHMGTWGQPRGIFGADEVIRSTYTDPRQGCETCVLVELNKGFFILGRITGDAKYADRCEDITLNHFPVSHSPDLAGIKYLTASNQPQLDASNSHEYANSTKDKLSMLRYSPHRIYQCCQHNVAMGWPWYAQNLWQATADNGLAAWMYAASEVTAKVGSEGTEVAIEEETDYPFRGAIRMNLTASEPVEFPLYLRVPQWCNGFVVLVNGKTVDIEAEPRMYVRMMRVWASGDTLEIKMPMELGLTEWPRNGSVTVDRGPLSYSVRIEEEWRQCGGTDEWPEWEVFPRGPWNYGLVIDRENPADSLEVTRKGSLSAQPWTVEASPVEIRAKAKRIRDWTLENETVQELRPSPIKSDEPEETIRMIPLGCARLRISCLPTIGNGLEAREWKV